MGYLPEVLFFNAFELGMKMHQVLQKMLKSSTLSVGSSFLIGKKNLWLIGATNFMNPYFALINHPLLFKKDLPKTILLGDFVRIIKVVGIFLFCIVISTLIIPTLFIIVPSA